MALGIALPASGADWQKISEAKSPLMFYGPGLKHSDSSFHRKGLVNIGLWKSKTDRFPRAEFVFQTLKIGYSYTQESSVVTQVNKWKLLKENYVEMGAESTIWNSSGKTSYVPFSIDGNNCVGLSRYFGETVFHEGTPRVGTKYIGGYFCYKGQHTIGEDMAEQLANAIGVRGLDEPVRPDGYE